MKNLVNICLLIWSFSSCSSQETEIKDISMISSIVTDSLEINNYEKLYKSHYGNNYRDSIYQYYQIKNNDAEIILKTVNIYNSDWATNTEYEVIISNKNNIVYNLKLNNYERVMLSNATINFDFVKSNEKLYIIYTNENNEYNIGQSLNLIVFDLLTKTILSQKTIFQQKYGITNLAITLSHNNKHILISYNDISRPNHLSLIYSVFDIDKMNLTINPKSVFENDEWEKREPEFFENNGKIYLLNTTGDDFGFFAYSGKKGIKISEISNENIINEKFNFIDVEGMNRILLKDNFLYYKTDNNSDFTIKKININSL